MQRIQAGLLALLAALVVACNGGDAEPEDLAVSLQEWEVGVGQELVEPGAVVIQISNQGTVPHQLVIIKTDLPPHLLPVADDAVELDKVNVVATLSTLQPGESLTEEVELTTGKYLFICNLVERPPSGPVESHYQNGMATPLLAEDG